MSELKGDNEQALTMTEEALTLFPKRSTLLMLKLNYLTKLGQGAAAKDVLQEINVLGDVDNNKLLGFYEATCREASESSHCASRKGQFYTDSILLPWVKKLEEYTELIDGNKIPDLHPLGHSDVKTCLFQFQAEEKLAATDLSSDHPDSGTHLAFNWLLTLTFPAIRFCFYFSLIFLSREFRDSKMEWCLSHLL